MALRVLKFGGTSVGSPEKILAVARKIEALHSSGDQVLVVVSAMGQTTDELTALAHRITAEPPRREMDMLLTAGERVSMALLAMALATLDCEAISFTGSQSGILTDNEHADARIFSVRPIRIEEELERGRVVIVAGFQGVSPRKEITTLGRGGSDTTAVAMAIRLGAAQSEIQTDVSGVLTADPRIVADARPIPTIDFDPMIVLSHLGGRVMYSRALRLARRFAHPVFVRSTHEELPGTRIGPPPDPSSRPRTLEEIEPMETTRLLAVALENPVLWLRTDWPESAVPRLPEDLRRGPCLLHQQMRLESGVRAEWILPEDGGRASDPTGIEALARDSFARESANPGAPVHVDVRNDVGLVSLIGDAANLGSDLSAQVSTVLAEHRIRVESIQAGAHALSILVGTETAEQASRVLHAAFLDSSIESE